MFRAQVTNNDNYSLSRQQVLFVMWTNWIKTPSLCEGKMFLVWSKIHNHRTTLHFVLIALRQRSEKRLTSFCFLSLIQLQVLNPIPRTVMLTEPNAARLFWLTFQCSSSTCSKSYPNGLHDSYIDPAERRTTSMFTIYLA